jgi:hypothetical protein
MVRLASWPLGCLLWSRQIEAEDIGRFGLELEIGAGNVPWHARDLRLDTVAARTETVAVKCS